MRYGLFKRAERSKETSTGRPSEWTQARRALLDFAVIMAGLTVMFAIVNVVGARAIPLPVLGLIAPGEFGVMSNAVGAVHGALAAASLAETTPTERIAGGLAITLACALFAALLTLTLWIFRRVRRTYSWRWSAHFD